ncbi:MAG: hypothetical protein WC497_05310 [Patescibacteria group bacterium]
MKGNAKKLYLLGGILIGGALVLTYFLVYPPKNSSKNTVKNINDDISLPAGTNDNANVNVNREPSISKDSPLYPVALARDTKRVADMRVLMDALTAYFNENGNYPESLTALLPDRIDFIPENPNPGGEPYVYTPIGTAPYNFYSLVYTLEVGTDDIAPGPHEATPQGLVSM